MDIIRLIGVDHKEQWDPDSVLSGNLETLLNDEIISDKPDLLAEEFSEEALRNCSITQTITQKVAKKYLINHIFCDPDTKTRLKLSYPTCKELQEKFGIRSAIEGTKEYNERKIYEKTFWNIREKYWLNQLKSVHYINILFVCGKEHINNFEKLLFDNEFAVKIITR